MIAMRLTYNGNVDRVGPGTGSGARQAVPRADQLRQGCDAARALVLAGVPSSLVAVVPYCWTDPLTRAAGSRVTMCMLASYAVNEHFRYSFIHVIAMAGAGDRALALLKIIGGIAIIIVVGGAVCFGVAVLASSLLL